MSLVLIATLLAGLTRGEGRPPPLDYGSPKAWVCRPERPCRDDLTATAVDAAKDLRVERFRPARRPLIDCFYVYPTVSTSPQLTAPPGVTEAERRAVRQQVERLTSVCRLFAPFYRQFTAGSMLSRRRGGARAAAAARRLVDADIFAAWKAYLDHDNHGRGVVLIGHSQGAGVLKDLIVHRIDGRPSRRLIVSAILPGLGIDAPVGRDVGGTFKTLPACRRTGQTGCVISFNSYRSDALIDPRDLVRPPPGRQPICTNPAALAGGPGVLKPFLSTRGETIIPALTAKQGPWTRPSQEVSTPFLTLPGYYTAECRRDEHGVYLSVAARPQPHDRRTGALVGDWIQDGRRDATMGLHLIDLNLVMGNLVEVLRAEALAWRAAHPSQAAQDARALTPPRGLPVG